MIKFQAFKISTSLSILILALTQVPFAVNEVLKLGCALSTTADYADFWQWRDISLDSRVRYCNGGEIKTKME